ncbi:MAG: hypothetical protein K2F78_05790, partial [Muribaculaceae bacterium]|nr:hypothetical protein [Muribaculaceae bacterium]
KNYPLRTEAGKGGCALYFSLNERAVIKIHSNIGFGILVRVIARHVRLSEFMVHMKYVHFNNSKLRVVTLFKYGVQIPLSRRAADWY